MTINPGTATVAEVASGTSLSATLPSLVDGVVLVAEFGGSDTLANMTITATGWTAIKAPVEFISSRILASYYVVVPSAASPPSTPSASWVTAGRATWEITPYTGVDQVTPLDCAVSYATIGTSPLDIPSVTTVTDGAMLISGCVVDSATAGTLTKPGTMTLRADSTGSGRRTQQADETFATPGATGIRTWTHSTISLAMAGYLTALRPAPSAAGASPSLPGMTWRRRFRQRPTLPMPITAGGPKDLDGIGGAAADAAGSIILVLALVGSGPAASTATGGLDASRPFDGTAGAAASGTGSLSVTRSVSGNGIAASDASGTFNRAAALTGSGPAASDASGSASADRPLDGNGNAAATSQGGLGAERPLAGSGNAAATATGDLSLAGQKALDGSGVAAAGGGGTLAKTWIFIGNGIAAADASGTLQVTKSLAGTGSAAANASGGLDVSAGQFTKARINGMWVSATIVRRQGASWVAPAAIKRRSSGSWITV